MGKNLNRSLVTGGTGFIGSALVKRLVKNGHEVIVFDNDFRGSKERLSSISDKITLIEGDIRDLKQVKNAVENCNNIFHLAFINGTRFFYEKPELVLEVGVKGALNTLEAALEAKVNTYVLASSSEVYQEPTEFPTSEKERAIIPDVNNSRYSYAGGKLISELLTINYLRNEKIRSLIFRPHNIFGPNMGFEHVIPELMKKLHFATNNWTSNSCEIEIQGDGSATRAFCYVEDAVDQIIMMFNKAGHSSLYHIGMNNERSILDLINDISAILNIQILIKKGETPVGGTSRRCPDISKIISLGYEKNDTYYKGLEKTLNWYKDYYIDN